MRFWRRRRGNYACRCFHNKCGHPADFQNSWGVLSGEARNRGGNDRLIPVFIPDEAQGAKGQTCRGAGRGQDRPPFNIGRVDGPYELNGDGNRVCPPGCGINPDGFTLEGHTLGLGLVPQSERSRADALGNSEPAQINAVHRTGLQLLLWRKCRLVGPVQRHEPGTDGVMTTPSAAALISPKAGASHICGHSSPYFFRTVLCPD